MIIRASRLVLAALLGFGLAVPVSAKDAKPAKPAAAAAADQPADNGIDFASGHSGQPVEIYADQGLELSQDARTVIGRVNAQAIRGHAALKGDTITAHYRDKNENPAAKTAAVKPAAVGPKDPKSADQAGGGSEIWRVEADQHVTISTPTQTAYGDHADYNIDDAVVVLTGHNLRLVTPKDNITARDSLEYWEHRQQAVARGNAVALHEDKRIQSDVLVADFDKDQQGKMAIRRAHAYDHVILTTETEVVTGDRGDYDVETGIVIVTGSVKITRGQNQLNGGYATVNLNTGISKMYPVAPGAKGTNERVKGLFVPQQRTKEEGDGGESPAGSNSPTGPNSPTGH